MKTAPGFCGRVVLFCLIVSGNSLVQGSQSEAKVHERINTIISETLKRGEFTTAGGVRVITRVPPLSEHVEEIRSYGDQAVLPLEEHFSTANAFAYELAQPGPLEGGTSERYPEANTQKRLSILYYKVSVLPTEES